MRDYMQCQPYTHRSMHERLWNECPRSAPAPLADGLYNTAFLGDGGVAGATTRVNFPHLNIKHPPVGKMIIAKYCTAMMSKFELLRTQHRKIVGIRSLSM